jgi:hypothetical protein
LLNVPGAKSSLGLPATVSRPGFPGVLELAVASPVHARYQPRSPSMRNVSDTFMDEVNLSPYDEVERPGLRCHQSKLIHPVIDYLLGSPNARPAIAPADCHATLLRPHTRGP